MVNKNGKITVLVKLMA